MAAPVPSFLISHSQKVCRLYKRALRNAQSWQTQFLDYRYEAIFLRKRFDDNKNIKDLRVAKQLLIDGEKELHSIEHPQPMCFPESVGGCAHDREVAVPDWVLDFWHPTEKDMYPKYFALREIRKKEYIEFYNKQYPNETINLPKEHQ